MTRRFRFRMAAGILGVTAVISGCGGPNQAESRRVVTPVPATATPRPQATPSAHGNVHIPVAGHFPVAGQAWYLTIGDSITSGYTQDPSRAGVNSGWPLQLQGLLATPGSATSLYDTACPGETTATYYAHCPQHDRVAALPDESQYQADLQAIAAAPHDLRFIVVALGSNDLLQAVFSGDHSATTASGVVTRLDGIVKDLQKAAPGVPVIVADYYDPFENLGLGEIPLVQHLDTSVAAMAKADGVSVVSFFGVINTPAAPDGHLCNDVDCAHTDIHPTVAGHAALAAAVLRAVEALSPAG